MADKLPGYHYRISLVRVIDGDTIEADIDLGFHTRIRTNLRLYGINCPEMNTLQGRLAREQTIQILSLVDELTADTIKADKYGNRWDAIIWLPDGKSLNDTLVERGYAVRKNY